MLTNNIIICPFFCLLYCLFTSSCKLMLWDSFSSSTLSLNCCKASFCKACFAMFASSMVACTSFQKSSSAFAASLSLLMSSICFCLVSGLVELGLRSLAFLSRFLALAMLSPTNRLSPCSAKAFACCMARAINSSRVCCDCSGCCSFGYYCCSCSCCCCCSCCSC